MAKTALILGATGGFGGEMARALVADGWMVRALSRDPARAEAAAPGAEGVVGDCLNREDVVRAADGAQLIVHGVHPPGYRNWAGLCMPMLENTIAAAKASGALILFPGTVYNYGRDAGEVVDERALQTPHTRKGKIRVAMETALAAAAEEGVRTIILRGGDFFGPRGGSSWLSQGFITPGKRVRKITYPGKPGVGHAYAYLPDMAKAGVALVNRNSEMAPFETFHFAGHYLDDGHDFAEVISDIVGGAKIAPMPWTAIAMITPFNETMREMYDMRFLWREPLRLDGRKLRSFLGREERTPLRDALETSLRELGCLQ